MATTSNLGLSVTSETDMETLTFLEWRLKQMGDGATSNANLINNWAVEISGSISSILPFKIYTVFGYGENLYASSGSSPGGLETIENDTIIILSVDNDTSGSASLDINSTGGSPLQKYNPITGAVSSLEAKDLIANRKYLFTYKDDTSSWIFIGPASRDQMYIPGDNGDALVLHNNTILNSGSSVKDMSSLADNIYTGSFVTWGINPLLPNSYSITAGSGLSIVPNVSASQIIIHVGNTSILNGMLSDNSVNTNNYIDNSIQTAHIDDGIIGHEKIVDTTRRFFIPPHISGSYPAFERLGYKAEEDDVVWIYGLFKVPADYSSDMWISTLGSYPDGDASTVISGSMYINYGKISESFGANSVSKSFLFDLPVIIAPVVDITEISGSALLNNVTSDDYVRIMMKKGAPENAFQGGTVYLRGFLVTYTADS